MRLKHLLFAFLTIGFLNACKNEKPNTTIANTLTEDSLKVNHLFNGEYNIELLELKPTYMGGDSSNIDSSDFVFTSIIRTNGIDTTLIKAKRPLDKRETAKLKSVLNSISNSKTAYECYVPKHGIAWYNSNSDLEAFLEICFECQGYKTWGNISISGLKDGAWFKRLETVLR